MPGIYDIFNLAAKAVDKASPSWRMLAGATVGVGYQFAAGNEDLSFGEKVGKGLFIGGVAGAGAGGILRQAGRYARVAEGFSRRIINSKLGQLSHSFKAIKPLTASETGFWGTLKGRARQAGEGFSPLMKPGSLMVGGAIAGSMIAPPGSKGIGAAIGGTLGLGALPGMKLYRGYENLGFVPGGQTGSLIAAAAIPVAAAGVFGNGTPEAEGAAIPGLGGEIDYQPIDGGMRDRMTAMNANGDIVLGLHGRQHG